MASEMGKFDDGQSDVPYTGIDNMNSKDGQKYLVPE
jgi:hypothetical protein